MLGKGTLTDEHVIQIYVSKTMLISRDKNSFIMVYIVSLIKLQQTVVYFHSQQHLTFLCIIYKCVVMELRIGLYIALILVSCI